MYPERLSTLSLDRPSATPGTPAKPGYSISNIGISEIVLGVIFCIGLRRLFECRQCGEYPE